MNKSSIAYLFIDKVDKTQPSSSNPVPPNRLNPSARYWALAPLISSQAARRGFLAYSYIYGHYKYYQNASSVFVLQPPLPPPVTPDPIHARTLHNNNNNKRQFVRRRNMSVDITRAPYKVLSTAPDWYDYVTVWGSLRTHASRHETHISSHSRLIQITRISLSRHIMFVNLETAEWHHRWNLRAGSSRA